MPVDNPEEVDGDRQSHQSDEEPEEPNPIMTGFGGYESDIDMVVDLETEEEEDCEEPEKKRRRTLEVPAREARQMAHEKRKENLVKGLCEIEKLIKSRKTQFEAGDDGF
jgi:hypothetical protein